MFLKKSCYGGAPPYDAGKSSLLVLSIVLTIIIVSYILYKEIILKKEIVCAVPVSYYKTKLGTGALKDMSITYSAVSKYLPYTKFCSISDIPKLSTFMASRYIAIIGNNTKSLSIPIDSINMYLSATSIIPINPTKPTIEKAVIEYPDITVFRNTFIFKDKSTYSGSIANGEIALIKHIDNNPINLYSFTFKYTGDHVTPISIFLFNPPSYINYNDGEPTTFTSFYQLNLDKIYPNTIVVIDFDE